MGEVAYKPLGTIKPSDADYHPILQVPNYDDVGVSYKGYSKTKISGSEYKLTPQETRFVSLRIGIGAFGSTLFLRPNWKKKVFYCTGILIHSENALGAYPSQIHIADVTESGAASVRFYHFIFSTEDHVTFLDLKSCPRKFAGKNFDLYTQALFALGDNFHAELFGWEE